MYKTIMVPVDLEHADRLEKALATAADLSRVYEASAHLVGVTAPSPTGAAHDPQEFAGKLEAFARDLSARLGVDFGTKPMVSTDPSVDLDKVLEKAAAELSADLIVMASHVPGFRDYVFASHAGHLASHTKLSVFVVR